MQEMGAAGAAGKVAESTVVEESVEIVDAVVLQEDETADLGMIDIAD